MSIFSVKAETESEYHIPLDIARLNMTEMTAPQITVRIFNGVGETAEVSGVCFSLTDISPYSIIEQIRIRYKISHINSDNRINRINTNTITGNNSVI